jgi:hypothetical protein
VGIRETLNRNPGVTAGAVGGIVVLVIIYLIFYTLGGTSGGATPSTKSWYTVDDGATYFADNADRLPPFDHDGKPAVRCRVFTCDHGAHKFVAYLERYMPEAQKRLAAQADKSVGREETDISGMEVKPPMTGEKAWIRKIDPRAADVMNPKCKEGRPEDLEEVPAE